MTTDRSTDGRWDLHTDRQLAASKGGALAVTVLNSASWIAILSQASNMTDQGIGWVILFWGTGALLGTALWLFIYRGTALQGDHDFDRDNEKLTKKLDMNITIGVGVAVASLVCFGIGVALLTYALV